MKFTAVASVIAFAFVGIAAAATVEVAGPVAAREAMPEPASETPPDYIKRACAPSKCLCNRVQGEFCGNEAINPHCLNTHVYECNRSTGHTCDYGYRASCARCGKLSC